MKSGGKKNTSKNILMDTLPCIPEKKIMGVRTGSINLQGCAWLLLNWKSKLQNTVKMILFRQNTCVCTKKKKLISDGDRRKTLERYVGYYHWLSQEGRVGLERELDQSLCPSMIFVSSFLCNNLVKQICIASLIKNIK